MIIEGQLQDHDLEAKNVATLYEQRVQALQQVLLLFDLTLLYLFHILSPSSF